VNRDLRWQSVHREYLKAAYELGELKDRNGVPAAEILEVLDLSQETGDEVLELLVEAGLVVWPSKGELMLTELGVTKAADLEREPTGPVIGSSKKLSGPLAYQHRHLRPALGHPRGAGAGEAR